MTTTSREVEQAPKRAQASQARLLSRVSRVRELGLLIVLLLLILVVGIQVPRFLSIDNFEQILLSIAILAIVGVGETLVLVTRQVDLSVGSIVGLTAFVTAYFFKELPGINLVKIVYGNDDDQTSFNATLALLQQFPNLKGIISPTTVGIAAAARAIESVHKGGQIALTGLGTPNSLRQYVKDGTIKGFELWNPANLGYLAYYTAALLAQGKIKGTVGETFTAGKLGKFTIGPNNVVLLGPPTVFDSSNIDQFNF